MNALKRPRFSTRPLTSNERLNILKSWATVHIAFLLIAIGMYLTGAGNPFVWTTAGALFALAMNMILYINKAKVSGKSLLENWFTDAIRAINNGSVHDLSNFNVNETYVHLGVENQVISRDQEQVVVDLYLDDSLSEGIDMDTMVQLANEIRGIEWCLKELDAQTPEFVVMATFDGENILSITQISEELLSIVSLLDERVNSAGEKAVEVPVAAGEQDVSANLFSESVPLSSVGLGRFNIGDNMSTGLNAAHGVSHELESQMVQV